MTAGGNSSDRPPLDRLLELLERLTSQGFDERREPRFDDPSVDVSISIGTIDDLVGGRDRPLDRPDRTSPKPELGGDARIDIREIEDGVLVVADVPAVDEETASATIDEETGTLRIAVDGRTVGSVPLDGEGMTIDDVKINNRILEVRLERSDPST